MEVLEARLAAMDQKLDHILELIAPVHAHAEWVDGLRSKLHRMGLVRNSPGLLKSAGGVGVSQLGDPPRYLHVPYPSPKPGDGEVGPVLAVPPVTDHGQ
jgi:hypothetical protein